MATNIRTEMQFSSETTAGKILPQSQKEKAFNVRFGEPVTLPKRSYRGIVLNKGDNNLTFTPQSATSEDGPWVDIPGAAITVKAQTEQTFSFAVPAERDYWRIQGAGECQGVVEIYEVDPTHANIGLP